MDVIKDEPRHMLAPFCLAAIVEVEHADRVQCQCNGCGQTVFKRVHIVVWDDGRIECWGSTCFRRELGANGAAVPPVYSGLSGRKLTEAERAMLRGNRERLLAHFKEEHERAMRERQEREQVARREAERAETERLDRTVRAFVAERLVEPPAPRRPRLPLAIPQTPPPPEPMHDPRYREVRERVLKQWVAGGGNIDNPGERRRFLENVQYHYQRGRR